MLDASSSLFTLKLRTDAALDYRAVDTVTNFTTMVDVFEQLGIEHVYLVTSDFHMPQARTIAFLVFESRGITCTPVGVNSRKHEESG